MRMRDKKSFAKGLILLSVFLAIFFAPRMPQLEWYPLGVIAIAALYSYWQALFRAAKPAKYYLSRAIVCSLLGLVFVVVLGVSSIKMIAFVALVFGTACVDLALWFNHRGDPTSP